MSVILLSGGLDSTVLLALELSQGRKPTVGLTFSYGQRHIREINSAKEVARWYGLSWFCVELPRELFSGSALTWGKAVPHTPLGSPEQKETIVPNRNMVFLSQAGSLAVSLNVSNVLFGANLDDAMTYPDCRAEFVVAMDKLLQSTCSVSVSAPLIGLTKKQVLRLAEELEIPAHLTWSCYEGGELPCGTCGACLGKIG